MGEFNLPYDRYMVTGGAGFIGSHLCRELLKQGKQVLCVDNFSTGKEENISDLRSNSNFKVLKEDVTRMFDTIDYVDVIFHLAAAKCNVCFEQPERDLLTNAWGTWNIINGAIKGKVKKIVHASTGSVFGGEPKSFYGVSKLAGESYYRAFSDYYQWDGFTVLRYHNIYGSYQDSSPYGGVIPIFIKKACVGQRLPIYGTGHQLRNFTAVEDVVRANLMAVTELTGGYFDVINPVKISIYTLSTMVNRHFGRGSNSVEYFPARGGDIFEFTTHDNSKLVKAGFEYKIPFDDMGFTNVLNWYVDKFNSQRENCDE